MFQKAIEDSRRFKRVQEGTSVLKGSRKFKKVQEGFKRLK